MQRLQPTNLICIKHTPDASKLHELTLTLQNEETFLHMKGHELAKLLKHGLIAFTILTHTFQIHLQYCFTASFLKFKNLIKRN